LHGQSPFDLAFYQAEDQQGQADRSDQGGDAPVVLQIQGDDGQGAFERRVAAFDRFWPLMGSWDYPAEN
jgi:hypothetical protein